MVLSHAKLKRKRKEEVAEGIVSGATAVPETSASAMNGPSEAVKEGKKEGKKKKKKGKKKQKTNDAPEVEATVVVESSEAVEEGKKRKLTGNKKQRTNDAAEVEALTAWEAVRAEEVKALKEKKKEKKMEKKMEKKEKKRNIREALEEAHSQGPLVGPVENGDNHVDNRTDETVSNGGAKTEQPVVENDGVAAAVSERPMSVREKKGKKKKGAKDRWGAKIADDVQEEHPVETVAEKESPPTSSTSAGELYESKKVVVGGMPYTTTEDDIHAYFYECGVISELDCMIFPDTGNFRGIAFITFETEEGAANALKYDGENMGGRFLKIDMCKVKPRASVKDPERGEVQKTAGSTSAYIGNLSWDITEDTIKSFFKKSYGNSKIDSVRLSFDKDTGEFKGFGHIDFGNDESLEAAIKLNQTPLLGRPLKIAYAVPPKGGSRSKNSANGNDSSETRRVGTCYTCGEEGHKAFVCPKRDANGNDKSEIRKVGACYNCGEEGHKSFLCPKKVPK